MHSLGITSTPFNAYSHAAGLGPLLDIFLGHLALAVRQIALVAHDHEGEVEGIGRSGGNEEFVLPLLQTLEGLGVRRATKHYLSIREIKRQDASVRTSVEGGAQALETLLTGSIPDLHVTAREWIQTCRE